MKKRILRCVLPLLLMAVMLASVCIPTAAMAITAPSSGGSSDPNLTLSYEDGILTFNVNAETLYAVISDRKLTKDELLEFLPADLLALFENRKPSVDEVKTVLSGYLSSDDLRALVNDIPTELAHRLVDKEMILDLLDLDELLAKMDIDGLLSAVSSEQIMDLIAGEPMKLMMTDALKAKIMNEAFLNDIIQNTTIVKDIQENDKLLEKLYPLITADVCSALVGDDEFIGLLFEKEPDLIVTLIHELGHEGHLDDLMTETLARKLYGDGVITLNDLKTLGVVDTTAVTPEAVIDSGYVTLSEILPYITAEIDHEALVEALYDDGVVTIDDLKTLGIVDFDAATPDDFVSRGYITDDDLLPYLGGTMTDAEIVRDLFDTEKLTLDELEALGVVNFDNASLESALDADIVTVSEVLPYIDDTLFDEDLFFALYNAEPKIITLDELRALGVVDLSGVTFDAVLEKEIMTAAEIKPYITEQDIKNTLFHDADAKAHTADVIGHHIAEIIPYVDIAEFLDLEEVAETLGYDFVSGYVDIEKVLAEVGGSYTDLFKLYSKEELVDIVKAIGKDRLLTFTKATAKVIDYKQIVLNLLDYVKGQKGDLKAFASELSTRFISVLAQDVASITVNGKTVFSTSDESAHPGQFDLTQTVAALLQGLPDMESFLAIPTNGEIASYSISMTLNPAKYPDAPTYQYGIRLGFIGNPEKLQDFVSTYRDLFNMDVSDDLDIYVSTILPAAVTGLYEEILTAERLAPWKDLMLNAPTMTIPELLETLENMPDEQLEKLAEALASRSDSLRAKIEAALARTGAVGDKVEPYVDRVMNALTTADGLKSLRTKALSKLNQYLPATLENLTLDDFYDVERGVFTFERAFEFNLYDLISRVVTLPEEIRILFVDGMAVSGSFKTDIGMNGLYRLEAYIPTLARTVSNGMEKKIFYLTEGMDLSELGIGDLMDQNFNPISTMPAGNVTLYSTEFRGVTFDFGTTLVDPVVVMYADGYAEQTLTELPTIPDEIKKAGYTYEWEYDLATLYAMMAVPANSRITVHLTETPPTVTIYDAQTNAVLAVLPYVPGEDVFTDWDLSSILDKEGYDWDFEGELPDLSDPQPNHDVFVRYTLKKYTVTFMYNGSVWATVEYNHFDTQLSTIPTVPTKRGYTIAWEDFTLNNTSFEVNAIETIITYKAYFYADGVQVGEPVEFTVLTQSITEPTVPAKDRFVGAWKSYELPYYNDAEPGDLEIHAEYVQNVFDLIFVDKATGLQIGEAVRFTVGDDFATLTIPDLSRADHVYSFDTPDLTQSRDITVEVTYTKVVFDLIFVDKATGLQIGQTIRFTVGDDFATLTIPDLTREGYTYTYDTPDLTQSADITVEVTYTIKKYTVTFKYNGSVWETVEYNHFDTQLSSIPAVPTKRGYTITWEDFTLNNTSFEVNAIETINKYKAYFYADGNLVDEVEFTVLTQSITEPTVPAKDRFVGSWESYELPYYNNNEPADLEIHAVYVQNVFDLVFVDKATGQQIGEAVRFTVGDDFATLTIPNLSREGYDHTFATPDLTQSRNVTVEVTYTKKTYTVTFVYGTQSWTRTYEHGATSLSDIPSVPTKRGYTVAWESFTLNNTSFEVHATETINTYKAYFYADGNFVGEVEFTVLTQTITAPLVPAKAGYTGVWSNYTLPFYHTEEPTDLTVNAQYTANIYTATFMADDKVVATVQFTVEDTTLAEPKVPEKEGYTGVWESYTIGASDMTIRAIYTPIDVGTDTTPVGGGDDTQDVAKRGLLWLWILIIVILCLLIAAIVILLILKNKNDDDDDTPEPPAPVVAAVPEPEPEISEVAEAELEEEGEEVVEAVAQAPVAVPRTVLSATSRAIINLGDLDANFEEGDVVTLEILKAKKLVSAKEKRLKILGSGTITKALTVEADYFSGSAMERIKDAGGTPIQK